jgi:hypothetical protein
MWYGFLADGIVAIHVAYVSFVVFGLVLIWIGLWRKWAWVNNRWFRLAHLLAIVTVALEALFDIECPLTVWERDLRGLAGQTVDEATFMGRLLHNILFYQAPPWVFTTCYVVFALVVVGTLILAPPRWRTGRSRLAA